MWSTQLGCTQKYRNNNFDLRAAFCRWLLTNTHSVHAEGWQHWTESCYLSHNRLLNCRPSFHQSKTLALVVLCTSRATYLSHTAVVVVTLVVLNSTPNPPISAPVSYEISELGNIGIIPIFPKEILESQYNVGVKGPLKQMLFFQVTY